MYKMVTNNNEILEFDAPRYLMKYDIIELVQFEDTGVHTEQSY